MFWPAEPIGQATLIYVLLLVVAPVSVVVYRKARDIEREYTEINRNESGNEISRTVGPVAQQAQAAQGCAGCALVVSVPTIVVLTFVLLKDIALIGTGVVILVIVVLGIADIGKGIAAWLSALTDDWRRGPRR